MSSFKNIRIEVPSEFPAEEFDGFMTLSKAILLEPKEAAWGQFAGASNAIHWRFRNCVESVGEYESLWALPPDIDPFELIYLRDRSIYQAFVAGLSAIDAAIYAIYALCSDRRMFDLAFTGKEQRNARAQTLISALAKVSVSRVMKESLQSTIDVLQKIDDDKNFALWKDLRNTMAHRSNLPRIISDRKAKPIQFARTSITPELIEDIDWLGIQKKWLGGTIRQLLVCGSGMASVRCSNPV